ncbi:MAG: peroxidase [Gemmatimonadota bacterium]|nr:peroxidase [Gemmatimonadota bacterium]
MLGDRDLVQAVLNDLTTAPLSEKDRALYAFVKRVNADSVATSPNDIDQLRKLGWTDEAIYDAITVCALFNFYNVWIDATGVSDMPAIGYEMSGHRLATEGYARND